MSTLSNYRRNIYSQNGEDGVIEEICLRLGIKVGTFVEFGGWDGKHLSNTYHLLEQGWRSVYIEADERKFKDLLHNLQPFKERVKAINVYVEVEGDRSLDNLLTNTDLGREFDLLSIDIDSYDWHIWKSFKKFHPKIVIIEINSSIPVGVFQTHRNNIVLGSSFTATIELGKDKGYTPVCHTGNLIFIRNDYIPKLGLPEEELKYPELLFDYGWLQLSWLEPIPFPLNRLTRLFAKLRKLLKRA